jgi:hypothetical protein
MEFKRFLRQGFLFAVPLFSWMLVIVVVDPFDYFNVSRVFTEETKVENAAALNRLVFNMVKKVHYPSENLIIGDSRAESLPLDRIEAVTGRKYSRLTAGALKLNECIDLFYFAGRQSSVKRAVFTLNFNQYNEYAYADRVTAVESMIQNPLIYLFDRNVAEAAFYVVKASLTGTAAVISTPPMPRDSFWDYVVAVKGREHYRYPEALQKRIREMANFANARGIEIVFIIVPNHEEFQRRVREFGLNGEYVRFKTEMSQLGIRVIDYDYKSDISAARQNFLDPLHFNREIGNLIVDEVFRGPLIKGKLLDASWASQSSQFLF